MKILIADDEPVSRKLMMRIMGHYGEFVAVENGKDAVNAFKAAWNDWVPFNLITLDINMPDKNGLEVLKEIREMESSKKVAAGNVVKIVMVTSTAEKDMIMNCINAGCNDYITKPLDLVTIEAKLVKLGFAKPSKSIYESS
ncbi:MAG: response regulator [Syntrophaceae bacterium]|nr:response regulator [Syntrophaceae bacterium]HOC59001.1 response regulator [Smithellaceae bacterium]HQM44909.1 response regulator [Smithellaceae bacterium]